MNTILVFLWMILMHICDDFYLQGLLIQLKQKKWWEQQTSDPKYKDDYKIALGIHAFSWSAMIMIPILVCSAFTLPPFILIAFIVNLLAHAFVDNAKANLFKLNLIEDQLIHIAQIIITVLVWLVI